jgi:hypothetical protein
MAAKYLADFSAHGLKVGRAARQKSCGLRCDSIRRGDLVHQWMSFRSLCLVDAICDELPQLGNVSIRSIHLN